MQAGQDGPEVRLSVLLDPELVKRLDAYVEARRDQEMTRSRAVRGLLGRALDEADRKKATVR